MFWIIISGFVVLVALAVVIYMLPSDAAGKPKKKKDKRTVASAEPAADTKDWKAIAERWEKQNHALRNDMEKFKTEQRKSQQGADELKFQAKELTEKLDLEKGWREKEQETLNKSKQHEKDLKGQISRTESDLEKEHSVRMRLERELQEIKIKLDALVEEKRQLSIQAQSQKTTLESNSKEINALRSENARLKEKREDIQWVAKSEYDGLRKELAQLRATHHNPNSIQDKEGN